MSAELARTGVDTYHDTVGVCPPCHTCHHTHVYTLDLTASKMRSSSALIRTYKGKCLHNYEIKQAVMFEVNKYRFV